LPDNPRNLRQRLISGAGAQLLSNVSLFATQLGTVSIVLPNWGLHLYGQWLILSAVPTYIALSELGLFSAAASDMTMAVGRGDRDHARDVFQAISRGVGAIFVVSLVALPVFVAVAPLRSWLHLASLSASTVSVVVVMLALRTLLITYAGLLYGGFVSEGHYGEGELYMAGVTFAEFVCLWTVVVTGHGPEVAAVSMFGCRIAGNAAMYAGMRRRVPWLRFGKPAGQPRVMRRLLRPGLASAAVGSGVTINIQGMLILIGAVLGPASVAIFSTVRAMTRVVFQLLSSITATVGPELGRAYGEGNFALLRTLQRRASQTAIWAALPMLVGLAIFGGTILDVWTHGRVTTGGWLLYLFLIAAGIDAVWFTCGGILWWTNRHPRVALIYIIATLAVLPLAYAMLKLWGLNGAAVSTVVLEVTMLVVMVREALPLAHDTLAGWTAAVVKPPGWALRALRAQIAELRGAREAAG
jgi:O-antigen/teichoic acid export membrane protein